MEVKVKPLVWSPTDTDGIQMAFCAFGWYAIEPNPSGVELVRNAYGIGYHMDKHQAKDAAQHDYNQIIRAAIIPPTLADALALPEIKAMVEAFKGALDVIEDVQTYKQPDDPWTENALTMGELDVFEFGIASARAALAALQEKE